MRLLLLALPLALLMNGCSPTTSAPPAPSKNAGLLEVQPSRLDLGDLKPKSKHERWLTIKNASKSAVELRPIETSCPCFILELPRQRLEAGETIQGKLIVDLAKEEDFHGGLALLATARTTDGRAAFEVRCDVNVAKP
jgi:hypothetical protein